MTFASGWSSCDQPEVSPARSGKRASAAGPPQGSRDDDDAMDGVLPSDYRQRTSALHALVGVPLRRLAPTDKYGRREPGRSADRHRARVSQQPMIALATASARVNGEASGPACVGEPL